MKGYIKLINHYPDLSRNKGRKIKSIKLEMKMGLIEDDLLSLQTLFEKI